jgi:hypothetical protein
MILMWWPVIAIIVVIAAALINVCAVNWVYSDAQRCGLDAKRWRRIVLFVPGGVLLYLARRPKENRFM